MSKNGHVAATNSWIVPSCFPSTSSTSASLYPVSPPDNTFALPTEVFLSCLVIVLAVTDGGLFLWPALRYGTGYQTIWETPPSAETPSDVRWRRFHFQLTCVHSALELSGRCALQIYLLAYWHWTRRNGEESLASVAHMAISSSNVIVLVIVNEVRESLPKPHWSLFL